MSDTPKKLTPKQRKYVEGRLDGQSQAKAAKAAGFPRSQQRNPKRIETPEVRAAFADLLERAGVTDELLARRIFEGLNAMESKFWQPRGVAVVKDAEGNEEVSVDGSALIRRDLVNYCERREMLEIVLKLTGKLVEKHEHRVGLYELLTESETTP